MNEYLESIRILLEIDEPNMELVDLIKSFPIKLIDGANSLFSNSEFELSIKEENTNYRIIKRDNRIRLSSDVKGTKRILNLYKCLCDDDIKEFADFTKFDREYGKISNVMSDDYFIYGNTVVTSVRSTNEKTVSYTSKLKKSNVKCKK